MKLMNPRSGNVRSRMSFAYPLTFLRRAMAIPALMSIMLALSVSLTRGRVVSYKDHHPYTWEEPHCNGFLFWQG
jgi:hypothetical protein